MTKKRKARTQVELIAIVVIVVAVTLAAIAIPRMSRNSAAARTRTCQTNVGMMNTRIEAYYSENGSWPAAMTDITNDSNYFSNGAPACPAGGNYSIDGTTHRVSCDASGHQLRD
jgi:competence protein ComGC